VASFDIEKKYSKRGFIYIAGVDEVGRGALFGPVLAAAVLFPPDFFNSCCPDWAVEINDSKLLPARKRERLKNLILRAAAVGLGAASVREIERLNIHQASLLAMSRAISRLPLAPQLLLIDGSNCRLEKTPIPQVSLQRGDRLCSSIAAASIVAKVVRDSLMIQLDRVFKGYDLCHNKGYGTKKHFQALQELGPTPLHRRHFRLRI